MLHSSSQPTRPGLVRRLAHYLPKNRHFRSSLLALLACLALPAAAQDPRDTAFLTARDAFRAGDRNKLERAASQVNGHELALYVDNYRLRLWMDQGDSAAMPNRNPTSRHTPLL